MPLPIERDDRRFTVFQVAEDRKTDSTFFADLRTALDNGERAAFLHDLLHHQIDEIALRTPLETAAKHAMRAESLPSYDRWWLDELVAATSWPERWSRADLHERCRIWFAANAPRETPPHQVALSHWLSRHFSLGGMPGWPKRGSNVKVTTSAGRVNAWVFPDLAACRTAFTRATGVTWEWDTPASTLRLAVRRPRKAAS
jgi:hypothetical protein